MIRSKPAASNGKSFLEAPPVKKPSSFVKSPKSPPSKGQTSSGVKSPPPGKVSFLKSPPEQSSSVKLPPGKVQGTSVRPTRETTFGKTTKEATFGKATTKETTFGIESAASAKSIKETSFVNTSAKRTPKEPAGSSATVSTSGGKSFLDAVAGSAGINQQLKSTGGKSFLDAVQSAGNSPFTTTFTSLDLSEVTITLSTMISSNR